MKPLDDTFMDWLKLHPFDRIHDDITVALSTLQENGYGEPFGILGFCLGGALTMYEIGQRKGDLDPAAAVAFYPSRTLPFISPALFLCFLSRLNFPSISFKCTFTFIRK